MKIKQYSISIMVLLLLLSGCSQFSKDQRQATLNDSLDITVSQIDFVESYPTIDVRDDEVVMLVWTTVENHTDAHIVDTTINAVAVVDKQKYQSEVIYTRDNDEAVEFLSKIKMDYIYAYKIPKVDEIKKVKIDFLDVETEDRLGKVVVKIDNFTVEDYSPIITETEGVTTAHYRDIELNVTNAQFYTNEESAVLHPSLSGGPFASSYLLLDLEIINHTDRPLGFVDYFLGNDETMYLGTPMTAMGRNYNVAENLLDDRVIEVNDSNKGTIFFVITDPVNCEELSLYIRPYSQDLETVKIKLHV